MKYPTDKCYFCGEKINHNLINILSNCNNKTCFSKYKYTADANGHVVSFKIKGYKFSVYDGNRIEVQPPKLTFNSVLDFNSDNYLDQIERLKKLEAFK